MIDLLEYNAERRKLYNMPGTEPVANGIACPKCGKELTDINPLVLLLSHPPQKDVYCINCGYKGFRIA